MFRKHSIFLLLFFSVFLVICFMAIPHAAVDNQAAYKARDLPDYAVYSLPLPDDLYFAGERVPLEQWDIRERFDRELLVNTYWQSSTLLMLKRANRWFPVIEPILAAHGVPDDFKYLALIESGLMNVVSPAGATGFWQILEGTGRDLGLEINRYVDERYHVEKATAAACNYLISAQERYGSWTMAAAAYNIGNSRLRRIIGNQRVDNYYDLHLNEETARYVFRILAMKTILEDPEAAGFFISEQDLYPPITYRIISIDHSISDLVEFAFEHYTTYKGLHELNPWLRSYELPNRSGKLYEIKVPAE